MKKLYILLFTVLIYSVSFAQVIIGEEFNYADGSLVGNGAWASHSGTAGDLMVVGGQVLVQHGTPSEDANIAFTSVAGVIYYALDFTVIDPGLPISGGDYEYFAHFKDAGFNFSARLDIVAPTAAGDFSVGIASDDSTADAIWATDLTYGVTYRATVMYNQTTNQAQLWIDATVEGDTSILGADQPDPGDVVVQFALRQSDSSNNEGILVDNVKVGTTFNATVLGVNDNKIEGFNLYPNPTSKGFINISSNSGAAMKVTVFDVLGKQVINEMVSNKRLDVSMLNTGVYIMRATQDNASTTKKLVIK
jgi:Secretion system C-terminal sorting domain